MTQTWQVDVGLSTHPSLSPAAVAQLFDALQSPQPARCMLQFINHRVPVEHLSLVHYADLPRQVEGHSLDDHASALTAQCFSLYQSHFSWADPLPRHARSLRQPGAAQGAITAHVFRQHEIPNEGWRQAIFTTHRLAGRLSLLYAAAPGRVFGLNLYRHERLGNFEADEVQRLLEVAPLLRQVHHQVLGVAQRLPHVDDRIATAEHRLQQHGPALTPRERQVCARIAAGITADGVAADLGIATSTVVTLRKRAYAKLGITDRLGLARLVY